MGQSDTQTPGNVLKQFKDCDENKTHRNKEKTFFNLINLNYILIKIRDQLRKNVQQTTTSIESRVSQTFFVVRDCERLMFV